MLCCIYDDAVTKMNEGVVPDDYDHYEHPLIGRVRKVPIQSSFSVSGIWHGVGGHILKVEPDSDGGIMIATAGWDEAVYYTNLLVMYSKQAALSALLLLHERQPDAVSYAINFTSAAVQERGMVDLVCGGTYLSSDKIRSIFLLGYYPSSRLVAIDCFEILTVPNQLFGPIRRPTILLLYTYIRCVHKIPTIEEIARYLNAFSQRIHPVELRYQKVVSSEGFVSYVAEREECLLHSYSIADRFVGVYEKLRRFIVGPRDRQEGYALLRSDIYPEKIAIRLRAMDLLCDLLTCVSDAIVVLHVKERTLFDLLWYRHSVDLE